VKINGTTLQTSDPALQPQLQALLNALIAKNEAIGAAQEHLRTVMNGS
jgi:hypothetical protein